MDVFERERSQTKGLGAKDQVGGSRVQVRWDRFARLHSFTRAAESAVMHKEIQTRTTNISRPVFKAAYATCAADA